MTQPKRPLKVFLCHAHADRDAVRALYTRLTNDGVDAWLDKEKLLGGQNWKMEIRTAVEEADVVIVCHSKEFNKEGFRQREVKWALDVAMEKPEGEIFIIPVRLEECEVIKSLREWHWVDLFESDGYEMLMRALHARANNIGATLQIKKSWLPIKEKQPAITQKESEEISKPKNLENDDVVKQAWKNASQVYDKTIEENNHYIASLERKRKWNKFVSEILFKFRIYAPFRIYILVVVIGLVYLSSYFIKNMPLQKAIPTEAVTLTQQIISTSTKVLTPTKTFQPALTSTQVITLTPTSLPTEITDAKGVPMALVPAGEFIMGSDVGRDDEKPAHTVYLDAYYIDVNEVTNAVYKACVDVGACIPPENTSSYTRLNYYNNALYDDYPVVYVDWNMAKTYCEWRGASLPTESQWEKAAGGGLGFTYPWGGDIDCNKANYFTCKADTTKVGSYESGRSPYGLYDMAGNVSEWVVNWFDAYPKNIKINSSYGTEYRVLRGGSWNFSGFDLRTSARSHYRPLNSEYFIGFRCAKDLVP